MQIKHIELKNFKFHHNLEFDIKQKNCLIYGENGTGKSSIYEALYSNFYHFKNKDIGAKRLDIREKYRHRDYPSEDMDINILFDDKNNLNKKDNDLENATLLDNKVIYFANERVLRDITEENFYDVIQNILQEHFPKLNNLINGYFVLKRELRHLSTQELISKRIELDKQFKIDFFEYIPLDVINDILMNYFDEKFEIEFKIENSMIEDEKLIYPQISIAIRGIDDRGNFLNHFNEAKLKLIGIAIYFALAKKYETNSDLKLLVLDDFLTSLDMANRKLIVQYILDNFEDYQKIILTHNIQFYNMIIKFLKSRRNNVKKEELTDWDIKNIFLTEENNNVIANIYNIDENYLKQAKKEFKKGGFQNLKSSGNFLRKEFERIMSEFEQLLEVGKKEELNNIILALKSDDKYFYHKPHEKLEQIIVNFSKMFNNEVQTKEQKIEQVKRTIQGLEKNKITFQKISNSIKKEEKNNIVTEVTTKIMENKTYNILTKVEFYKNILLNPSSHDNLDIEVYKKECETTIDLLSYLNKLLNDLK